MPRSVWSISSSSTGLNLFPTMCLCRILLLFLRDIYHMLTTKLLMMSILSWFWWTYRSFTLSSSRVLAPLSLSVNLCRVLLLLSQQSWYSRYRFNCLIYLVAKLVCSFVIFDSIVCRLIVEFIMLFVRLFCGFGLSFSSSVFFMAISSGSIYFYLNQWLPTKSQLLPLIFLLRIGRGSELRKARKILASGDYRCCFYLRGRARNLAYFSSVMLFIINFIIN